MKFVQHGIFVCRKRKFMFFVIYKCGSTSVRGGLGLGKGTRILLKEAEALIDTGEYKLFTVYRKDSLVRFVSAYLEDCDLAGQIHWKWLLKRRFYPIKDPHRRFLGYLKELEETGTTGCASQQRDFLRGSDGQLIPMDMYLANESLQQDFQDLCDALSIPRRKLPYSNVTNKGRKKKVLDMCTPEIQERIRALYEEDDKYIKTRGKS